MADENEMEPTEEVTQNVTYRKYVGVSISSLLQEYDASEPKVNQDPNLFPIFGQESEEEDPDSNNDGDESEISPVSDDELEGGSDGEGDPTETPSEEPEESEGKYGYGLRKYSTVSTRDIEDYYGKDEIRSVELLVPKIDTDEPEDDQDEDDVDEEEQEPTEPTPQEEGESEYEEESDKKDNLLSFEDVIVKKCPKSIKDKLKGLKIGLVNNKIVLINFENDINFLEKLYDDKDEDYETAKKEYDELLNRKFYIGFDIKVTFKVNPEDVEEEPEEDQLESQTEVTNGEDPEGEGNEEDYPTSNFPLQEDITANLPRDKVGTYVTLEKNDGSNQRVTRFFKLNDKYTPKIISELIKEIKESSDVVKFEEREPDYEWEYSVKGYSDEVNDDPNHTYNRFELNHFTMFFGDFSIFTLWNATERQHKVVEITIKKNDGSEDSEVISFKDYDHTAEDDVNYIKIEDKISGSMKIRPSDQNFIYSYYGLSESEDGKIINTTEKKFTQSTTLYIIWNKEPIIYIEKESDLNPDSYVKHGELQFIEGVLFVQPEDSEIVKKLVYCNGFYYLLCMNNKIYKLLINDTNRIVTKIFDLSGYNSDISKTDIFACDNVLVIKTGKYILTDKETIKSNFGIDDSSLLLKINNTIQKLNTKTIVKIDVK